MLLMYIIQCSVAVYTLEYVICDVRGKKTCSIINSNNNVRRGKSNEVFGVKLKGVL